MPSSKLSQELMQFNDLAPKQLYRILQLRSAVFVVEQTCYYQDLDGLDTLPETRHLILQDGSTIAGYARILAPWASYSGFSSIGRVMSPLDYRGTGIGHQIVKNSIETCLDLWPEYPIKIGAQVHLSKFYQQHGFKIAGESYIEDGIPHIHMVRNID